MVALNVWAFKGVTPRLQQKWYPSCLWQVPNASVKVCEQFLCVCHPVECLCRSVNNFNHIFLEKGGNNSVGGNLPAGWKCTWVLAPARNLVQRYGHKKLKMCCRDIFEYFIINGFYASSFCGMCHHSRVVWCVYVCKYIIKQPDVWVRKDSIRKFDSTCWLFQKPNYD